MFRCFNSHPIKRKINISIDDRINGSVEVIKTTDLYMAELSDPNHVSLTYKTIWTKFPDMRFTRDTFTKTWFCMNILTANVGWT